MTRHDAKKATHRVRSIKTKRDFEGASAAAKRLADEAARDQAAEVRLQLLLKELDKFDTPEDDEDADSSSDYDYPGPGRRWSSAGESSSGMSVQ